MTSSSHKPLTLRDLAKECGISRTTVSLALRNSPKVSAVTRKAVNDKARETGYQVDANVAKLMTYLRRRGSERALCNLGWLNCSPREHEWQLPWNIDLLTSAQERAAELGYAMEEIFVGAEDFNWKSLPRLLRARGIDGIIIGNPHMCEVNLRKHIIWSDLCAVVISTPIGLPDIHHVEINYSENTKLALSETLRLGYKRPALMLSRYQDWISNWAITGQYNADHGSRLVYPAIPTFWTQGWNEHHLWDADAFLRWFEKWKPDVLFVMGNEWKDAVQRLGLRIPRDVGMAHLCWAKDVPKWAGVDPLQVNLGSSAVDLLIAHIQRGEKGLPPFVKKMLITGIWRKGNTVRKR